MNTSAEIFAEALVGHLARAGIELRAHGRSLVAMGPLRALLRSFAELRARRGELLAYLKSIRPEAAS